MATRTNKFKNNIPKQLSRSVVLEDSSFLLNVFYCLNNEKRTE
jgi:hypothetical protein